MNHCPISGKECDCIVTCSDLVMFPPKDIKVRSIADAICEALANWMPEPLHLMAYEDAARAAIAEIDKLQEGLSAMFPEGMMREVPAPEFKTNGVTPIAVERHESGEWKRLGYAAGFGATGHIVSIDEWLLAVKSAQ